ncbi:MAG: alpha/beta hydrolase [Pseudomonadota bacterium]
MKTATSIIVFISLTVLMPALYCRAETKGSYPPLPEALNALNSDDNATVLAETLPFSFFKPEYFVFKPVGTEPTKGFIFYPGGKIDPRAYAPPAHDIAAAGYLVVIVSMPFDLAPFGWKRAHYILQKYPSIKTWAIGGHSVGGAFACSFVKNYPGKVNGLVLWASTPSELFRLNATAIKAISIYGTNDLYPEQLAEGAAFLPYGTPFVVIQGGNHTQFGYIDTSPDTHLPKDTPADIPLYEQQKQIITATIEFLEGL